jgi:hypothetical protein
VVSFTPRPLYPQGKSRRYPLDRRLGGLQSRSTQRKCDVTSCRLCDFNVSIASDDDDDDNSVSLMQCRGYKTSVKKFK